jgi:hypothetical protein
MKPHNCAAVTILFVLLAASSHAAAATAPVQQTVALTPVWTRGGEEDDVYFGDIQQVTLDAAGNILVVDRQLSRVQLFSSDGEHLATLTPEGDGPGEVRSPYSACLLPGGAVAVSERFAGKVVVVEADGTPRATWSLHTMYNTINTLACDGGNLLLAGQRSEPTPGGQVQYFILAGHDPADGKRRCVYVERKNDLQFNPLKIVETGFFTARQRLCAVGPDGRVYAAADRDAYSVDVFAPDGTLERTVTRPFEPWRRDDGEKARVLARLQDDVRNVDMAKEFVVADCDPVLEYLRVDDAGYLWVQHARSWRDQPPGVLVAMDVFDPEGILARQVRFVGPGNARDDTVWLLPNGRVAVVIGGVGGERALAETAGLDRPVQLMLLEEVTTDP